MGQDPKTARLAGALYLVLAVGSLFAFAARSRLITPGDAAATLQHLAAGEALLRWSVVGDLVAQTAFALLALVLHELLKAVDRGLARLMALLVLVSVPIALLNLQHLSAVLPLLRGGEGAPPAPVTGALVMAHLSAFRGGVQIAQVFWGLWLLPFGWLVYRSGFLPRALGILVMLGSVGYLLESARNLLALESAGLASSARICPAGAGIAEFAVLLWLLVRGIRVRPAEGADLTPPGR